MRVRRRGEAAGRDTDAVDAGDGAAGAAEPLPLGVHRPLARQLRTAYSPRVSDVALRNKVKALVIGDPDDSLAYARAEAQAVAEVLRDHGIEVALRLGPPGDLGLGKYGVEPADLFDVVTLLQDIGRGIPFASACLLSASTSKWMCVP